MKKSNLLLSVANAAGIAAVITINALANILPIAGKTTGELSNQYPNLFVPAGYTFSIWGFIYLLQICFALYGIISSISAKGRQDVFPGQGTLYFLISCAANILWIFSWHYEHILLSLLFMFILLVSLLRLYLLLGIGLIPRSAGVRFFVHMPVSVYLGWISVAAVANVTAVLVAVGWKRFGLSEQFWTAAMIVICTSLSSAMVVFRRDPAYSAVTVWALAGILSKLVSQGYAPGSGVNVTVIISIAVLSSMITALLLTKKSYLQMKEVNTEG